jgi:type II secretion system protein N
LRRSVFARGRWILAALGILLFAFIFLSVFLYALPMDTVLSPLRSALGRRGIEFSCEDAGIGFPLRLVCNKAVIAPRSGPPLSLDSVVASWEWTGLLQGLPIRMTAKRGASALDIRTSPMVTNPGKVRIRMTKVGSDDLAALLAGAPGTGFLIETADLQWKRTSSGAVSGTGEGSLPWLRFPVPAQDSPVREALLRDVTLKFVIRGGTLHVSSLTGTYEGSAVDGTGEIARFLTPSQSAMTFHLRIQNPLEGRIATLFNLVAKNTKNANLRIKGTLLAPAGEFQFF